MAADITIPADDAKRMAGRLRGVTTMGYYPWIDELADLLDPPAPSLRDEVAAAIRESYRQGGEWEDRADAALAVVRRHVEALPVAGAPLAGSDILLRADVLRLLGAGDE